MVETVAKDWLIQVPWLSSVFWVTLAKPTPSWERCQTIPNCPFLASQQTCRRVLGGWCALGTQKLDPCILPDSVCTPPSWLVLISIVPGYTGPQKKREAHSMINLGFSGGGWISFCRTELQTALQKSHYCHTKGTFSNSKLLSFRIPEPLIWSKSCQREPLPKHFSAMGDFLVCRVCLGTKLWKGSTNPSRRVTP